MSANHDVDSKNWIFFVFFLLLFFYFIARVGYFIRVCVTVPRWSHTGRFFYIIIWSKFTENNETKQAATLDNFRMG